MSGDVFFFYPKYGTKCHKPLKNRSFLEVCKFCDKIKKLKKGLEMGGKVVYNESKWQKVVNSGTKWGESGRPIWKKVIPDVDGRI